MQERANTNDDGPAAGENEAPAAENEAPAAEGVRPEEAAPAAGGATGAAGDAASGPAEAGNAESSETETLRAEVDALNDKLLRRTAEFQNFRRRSEEQKGRLTTNTVARALKPMLGVVDDFERTIEAASELDKTDDPEAAYNALKEGVAMVLQKLRDELGRQGVEPIEAKGQPFDEKEHEAVMQQPAPEGTEPGTVLEEVQRGYRMDERVLRHSKVVVAAENG